MDSNDRPPPERLWHYTNGAAAKGIIQSRALWASHLGYMSDTSEVNHAMSASVAVARRLLDELPAHAAALQNWINYTQGTPPAGWAPNIFAVCFTEVNDSLNQWRGYAGGPGGGMCLGFPAASIRDRAERLAWRLAPCVYDEDEQERLLESRIRENLALFDETGEVPDGRTVDDYVGRAYILPSVMGLAPLIKHPAFHEEREWRLCSNIVRVERGSSLGFAVGTHFLKPYVEFKLTDDAPLDGLHWLAGPGPRQAEANSALGWLAKCEGLTHYQGMASNVPYLP